MQTSKYIGKVTTEGPDPNDFTWEIPGGSAQHFETFIYITVKEKLATISGSVKVKRTPKVGDEGRDLEISFIDSVRIHQHTFRTSQDGCHGTIFVECKTTSSKRLNDDFLVDITQHETGAYLAYVLITNATITPDTHYRAEQTLRARNAEFILLDRARLYAWLFANHTPTDHELPFWPQTLPSSLSAQNPVIHLQHRHERSKNLHAVQSYLVVRNHSSVAKEISFASASELSWDSDIDLQVYLEPGDDRSFRFQSHAVIYGLESELGLRITHDGRCSRLSITTPKHDLVLDPPFMGGGHRQMRDRLIKLIGETSGFRLISVEGEAGVGKSRTIIEALTPMENGLATILRLFCDSGTGQFDFTPILDLLPLECKDEIVLSPETLKNPVLILKLVSNYKLSLILVLEDLHHCSESGIKAIKNMVAEPPATDACLVLIVTGRNDHTFPNAEYFSFLELARMQPEKVSSFELCPLQRQESTDLIRSIVKNLPDNAVDHIQRISQNNPFIIVEVIQYLLDAKLAELLSRQTIGIVSPERFVGVQGLPQSVEELYQLRLNALMDADRDHQSTDFLCFLAIYGGSITIENVDIFFSSLQPEPFLSPLRSRRFLRFDLHTGMVEFVHENLIHATRLWLRDRKDHQELAKRLLRNSLITLLGPFQKADLQLLAGFKQEAFEGFMPIWNRIKAVTNFSSEEIDRNFYKFLPSVFEVARSLNQPKEDLSRLAVTAGYMGVHNFSLFEGEQACKRSLEWLDLVHKNYDEVRSHNMALRQLRAHALQNMGRTGESLRIMLELQSEIQLNEIHEPTLEYDLYDRLQEHYRRSNHGELMNNYGKLSARAVKQSCDERLLSAHLITQSLTCFYKERNIALNAVEQAISSAESAGIRRFVTFNRLSRLIVEALYAQERKLLREVYQDGVELLKFSAAENFSDSIIRLQLLLGTLSLQIHDDPVEACQKAMVYVKAGREAAARFGVGLYNWGMENLNAVILAQQPESKVDEVAQAFNATLDRLHLRGLLFVGACDGTFPNVHAISNIVRFRGNFSECSAAQTIKQYVSSYTPLFRQDKKDTLPLVIDAVAGKALFWPKNRVKMLRYPPDGYFTPLF